ncbi:HET-domain-containing protein [Macroventuria anomochaeta]|uniref:HET-domain-containing protein n=1 Tax=Macroventuria anomochaeta TaxID=301207 RepID=A0ACB6S791_9PLEO|nr:HET-domain-containing protein [Macroventuria anomochaeta]KAF2629382.1 HET-domain-containing protein [Macroventuria anomochaeta]
MQCCYERWTSVPHRTSSQIAGPDGELIVASPANAMFQKFKLLKERPLIDVDRWAIETYATPSPDQQVEILLFPDEQSFRLSYPSPLGTRLAFIAEDQSQILAGRPDTARYVLSEDTVIPRIEGWLQTCDQNHATCLRWNKARQPASLDTPYVALSYVWGQTPMLKLQKDNLQDMLREGSLDRIRNLLPKTVTDTIDLLKEMGEKYLWVDRLCLIQDDADDVTLGISMMDSIYRGSYFTVVAASGHDANAGLPAMSRGHSLAGQEQHVARLGPNLNMTALHSIDWHLQRSTYSQRGWTLQELVLPSRTLVFINGQVYFRCQAANWGEETCADQWHNWLDDDDNSICRMPDTSFGFLHSSWAYQKLCEDFSRRQLRNDADALRAFAGVARPTAVGMDTPTVEGLPAYYLDHFVLFMSSDGQMRRREGFASFSWAGWEGVKLWPRENFEWPFEWNGAIIENRFNNHNILMHLKHNRLISWYALQPDCRCIGLTHRSSNKPSPLMEFARNNPHVVTISDSALVTPSQLGNSGWIMDFDSFTDAPNWDDSDRYSSPMHRLAQLQVPYSKRAIDHANIWTELDKPFEHSKGLYGGSVRRDNWLRHRRRIEDQKSRVFFEKETRWRTWDKYQELDNLRPLRVKHRQTSKSSHQDQRLKRQIEHQGTQGDPQSASTQIPNFPPYTVLQFTTISLHLKLGPHPEQPKSPNIMSDRIPGAPLLSTSDEVVGSLHSDNIDLLPKSYCAIELLIVARGHKPTAGSALLDMYHERDEQPMKLFWVMYVVWQDGIAERRGIGQILELALENAVGEKPTTKSVLLG